MATVSDKKPNPKTILDHDYIRLKKCKHGFFAYNHNDLYIGRSLDLYGEWSESELELIGQIIKPGDTVVDIGAYIGTHSVFFAQSVGTTGSVVAIEPQRMAYYLLCANLALNAHHHTICLNVLASNSPGRQPVPLLDPHNPQNFGALPLENAQAGVPTQTITLDQLNLDACHFIKIDVEQMELKVLQGAQSTIQRHRPNLFVENTHQHTSPPLLKFLDQLQYQTYWHIAPHYNPQNFFGNPNNVFSQIRPDANLLAIPKEKSQQISGLEPVIGADDDWSKLLTRIESRYHAKQSSTRS